jgi:hypothetical protein
VEFSQIFPQFSLQSVNRLERLFINQLKWDLYISSSLYAKYYFALRSLYEKVRACPFLPPSLPPSLLPSLVPVSLSSRLSISMCISLCPPTRILSPSLPPSLPSPQKDVRRRYNTFFMQPSLLLHPTPKPLPPALPPSLPGGVPKADEISLRTGVVADDLRDLFSKSV